jgi:hypothetical protein
MAIVLLYLLCRPSIDAGIRTPAQQVLNPDSPGFL